MRFRRMWVEMTSSEIDSTLPLSQAGVAHARMEPSAAIGKIVPTLAIN